MPDILCVENHVKFFGKVEGVRGVNFSHFGPDGVGKTLRELLEQEVDLDGLSIHMPNLEDRFIKPTGASQRS